MADMLFPFGLQALNVATNHYQKVWDPIQNRWKKVRGKNGQPVRNSKDDDDYDERGYQLRRRSQVGPGEEIVDTVRHRGQVLDRRPGRPGMARRPSSMDDVRGGYSRNRDRGYESEGSVPPRGRVRAQSASQRKGSSSSSPSSSDVGSSSGDDRKVRHMQRKKWITAGLATVATVHAASKIYGSIAKHDKRIMAVQAGEMSPEEAHAKQRSARWQDAAAIGIAALGIKGAIAEWNEMTHEHDEHMELKRQKDEHHQKRLEKARRLKAKNSNGYYKGRDGNWYYAGNVPQDSERGSSRRASTWNDESEYQRGLPGPRQTDRKLIEDERPQRPRSTYGDRERSRARSVYSERDRGYDRDSHARSYGGGGRGVSRGASPGGSFSGGGGSD